MRDQLRMLGGWWREDVDYRWVVGALASRSTLGVLRAAIGLCGLAGPTIGLLAVLSAQSPQHQLARIVLWILIALGVVWTLRWWLGGWPSEWESLLLAASADVCITLVCALSPGYVVRSVGMMLLLIVGVYVSAFHGTKALAVHTVWSLTAAVLLAVPMFSSGDISSAVILILGMGAAVVVPPGLQFCYWALRSEMLSDPLTMLLSRRGLDYHSAGMFARPGPIPVSVMMIDLDRFKAVNDTFGHSAGDDVLVRIAERLRGAAPAHSIVSRFGGEEFAIIVRMPVEDAREAAERLLRAVAEPIGSISVTASIGLAVFHAPAARPCDQPVREVIRSADTAMYEAKQRGGNAVVVAGRLSMLSPASEGRSNHVRHRA